MTQVLVLADIGILALFLLLAWLAGAAISSEISGRKGYGEKPGLGTGLLLSLFAIPIWLVIPPKANSLWANRRERKRRTGSADTGQAKA